ncbi:MAG TPA: hypothetical protein VH277_15315, partial [Gemmatimonadaceae bacterium]|nr:hypothetical protein [Gemmatimonadaceae bacterium]
TATVYQHAIRPGDHTDMVHLPVRGIPQKFYSWVGRITVSVCYASVFEQYWSVVDTLGKSSRWSTASRCPAQAANTDL